MNLASEVYYKSSVLHELKKLDVRTRKRIVDALEKTLRENPEAGSAMKGQFSGLFRLRVGEYRIIYTRIKDGVLILRIGQRKNIYK